MNSDLEELMKRVNALSKPPPITNPSYPPSSPSSSSSSSSSFSSSSSSLSLEEIQSRINALQPNNSISTCPTQSINEVDDLLSQFADLVSIERGHDTTISQYSRHDENVEESIGFDESQNILQFQSHHNEFNKSSCTPSKVKGKSETKLLINESKQLLSQYADLNQLSNITPSFQTQSQYNDEDTEVDTLISQVIAEVELERSLGGTEEK
jgi:hypothetical protein